MMNTEGSNWGNSKMRQLPLGAQRRFEGEVTRMRPLTLRQMLCAFWGTREEGSQLVEMAMVAPILLVILTGMASFGMALYTQQQLGLAASNAVQAVATGASYISDPCATTEADAVKGLPSNWAVGSISFTLTITMVTSGTTTTKSEAWSGTSYPSDCVTTGLTDLTSTAAQFQPLTLQVSYPYTWFPIMGWANWGSKFKPSGNLTTTQAAMIQ